MQPGAVFETIVLKKKKKKKHNERNHKCCVQKESKVTLNFTIRKVALKHE